MFSKSKQITKEYAIYFKIPNGKIKDYALFIARKHKTHITPHIAVLQSVFLEESLPKVCKVLSSWAKDQKPFQITFMRKIEKGLDQNTFWNVQTAEHLHQINSKLTKIIDPLSNGLLNQVKNNISSFSKEELANIKKYGRHFYVPGSNHPHITVAYGAQNSKLINEISNQLEKFEATQDIYEISFGEIEENGNIFETLHTYKLGL